MPNQTNGFVLVLAHCCTIISSTTVEKKCPCITLFAFNQGANTSQQIRVIWTAMG